MRLGKMKKRWLIYRPPGMNRLMTHYMIKPFKEFAFFSVFYDTLYPKIINYFTSFDRMFDSDVISVCRNL